MLNAARPIVADVFVTAIEHAWFVFKPKQGTARGLTINTFTRFDSDFIE